MKAQAGELCMAHKKISFKDARKLLDTEPDCVMIDVRDEEEYITGHPTEAELLPVDCINEETAAELIRTKDTPVIVYCRTGVRSAEAAEYLDSIGYTRVYDLGSLIGWPYSRMV